MRTARLRADGVASYHCMSRIIQRQMLLGDVEKEKFRVLMRQMEDFCGVRILTYAIMTNHFHLLVQVPRRREVSDRELIRRVRRAYSAVVRASWSGSWQTCGKRETTRRRRQLKRQYTYRMYDISEFMKTLKQRFTQWYNRKNGRKGTLVGGAVQERAGGGRAGTALLNDGGVHRSERGAGGPGGGSEGLPVLRLRGGGGRGSPGAARAGGGDGGCGAGRRTGAACRGSTGRSLFERGASTETRAGISPAKVREVVEGKLN